MQRIPGRLTYANVVATLALFLAIGGASALAAGHLAKGSVGARQLKPGAVGTTKIRDGAVTAAKIASGAVPAVTAADAATPDGSPAAAFTRGDAQILTARADPQLGEDRPLLTVPGVGALSASCKAGAKKPVIGASLSNDSGAPLDETLEYNTAVDGSVIPPGKSVGLSEEGLLVDRVKVATRSAPPAIATIDVSGLSEGIPADCAVFAQVIVSR